MSAHSVQVPESDKEADTYICSLCGLVRGQLFVCT